MSTIGRPGPAGLLGLNGCDSSLRCNAGSTKSVALASHSLARVSLVSTLGSSKP